MRTKCHLIIRIDEFLPVNIGNIMQILRQSIGDFDRITLCPANSLALRFQKHFKTLEEQLNILIDIKDAKQLSLQVPVDDFVVVMQSDSRVGPEWLRTLTQEALRIPRFATLSPTFLSAEELLRLRSLKDRFDPKEPLLNFPKIIHALRQDEALPRRIVNPSGTCLLISLDAIEKLSFESKENLFSNTSVLAAELRQWEFYDLPHFVSTKTVVVPRDATTSEEHATKRVFSTVELYGSSAVLPPILYVLHEDIEGVVGGTELHTRDLVVAQKEERRVFVLFRSQNALVLRFYFRNSARKLVYSFSAPPSPILFSSPEMEQIFSKILSLFKIGIVHFQHLLGLPLSFLPIARARCATAITMNDYFLYCENYDFLNEFGQFCAVVKDPKACDNCLSKSQRPYRVGPIGQGQTYRRRYWLAEELQKHNLIYPSGDIRDRILSLYGLDKKRSFILEPPSIGSREKKFAKVSFPVMNISYIGVFTSKKGARVFRDLVLHLNQKYPEKIRWFVFGKVADSGMASFLLDQKNVSFVGEYQRSDTATLFHTHDIDLSLVLSIWPETYSFTLTESFMAGVPSIATDIGAQGHRVQSTGAGWTVGLPSAVEEIEKIIESIFESPEELLRRQRQVPEIQNHEEQVSRFKNFYAGLVSPKKSLEQSRAQMDPAKT